jgi:hypothetical protein
VGGCERRDEREAIVEIPVKWEELELRLVTNLEAHRGELGTGPDAPYFEARVCEKEGWLGQLNLAV